MAHPDSDPSSYFEPRRPCDILGMKLELDPERGAREFPDHSCVPTTFVLDPGEHVHAMGMKDLEAGDALWLIGGDLARFNRMYVPRPADAVSAIVGMYAPGVPTISSNVYGRDVDTRIKKGWTACRSIRVPKDQIEGLRALRDALRAHANAHDLEWREPERYFTGGSYTRHVVRSLRRIRNYQSKVHPKERHLVPIEYMPVHEQFEYVLHWGILRHAPCSVIVRRDGEALGYEAGDEDSASIRAAGALRHEMKLYQIGSTSHLFASLRRLATGHPRARTVLVGPLQVEIRKSDVIRLTATEPSPFSPENAS